MIEFPAFGIPPSVNELRGKHWSRWRAALDPYRDAAFYLGRSAIVKGAITNVPAEVRVWIPFQNRRRRDPHNYVDTVVKAVVDGLVRAGFWPDDTPEWVTVLEPTLYMGTDVRVFIIARPNAVHLIPKEHYLQ